MISALRRLLASDPPAAPRAAVPAGERVYAVGDVHGRLDLLEELAHAIEEDDLASADAETSIVLLGDLIDRGPEGAGVVSFAREWMARRTVRILAGNHEEMFLRSFDEVETLRHFLRHGGRATVLSYGISERAYNTASLAELAVLLEDAVPPADRAFIRGFEDRVSIGDYLFVHAGIAPGVPLEGQKPSDLRWIREPFLRHKGDHGHVVVHGHTIEEEIVERPNRIGIDTGAFRTGRLTALVLEGDRRRFIQTVERDGAIGIERGDSLLEAA